MRCNKIFIFKQEFDILLYLKNNFINKNEMLCDQMIKLYAIDVYKSLNFNKNFNASSEWYTNFKNKFYLSIVRCSIFKKSTTVYSHKIIFS